MPGMERRLAMCKYEKGKKCDRGCRYWNTCAGRSVKNTMEEVKEELKPCPFCGNMAEIETFEVKKLFKNVKGYFVQCKCCENRTEIKLDIKDSINAWNRRVNDGKID